MREWRLLVFLLMTFSASIVAGASGSGADSATGDSLTGTTWNLIAVAGRKIDPALPAVTLRFEADGALGGLDGCNRYRGSFSVEGAGIHIPGEIAVTKAACPEPVASLSHTYLQALGRAASYSIEDNRLSLSDAVGEEVAAFEAVGRALAGTAWKVIAYNNGRQAVVSVLGGTNLSARFGEDSQVTGSAGCNRYFARYDADGESISIGLLGTTRRLCTEPEGAMDQEARFLKALQSVATFRLDGERLALRAAGGALAMTLARDSAAASTPVSALESKIRFDLDRLDADGLQGPPGGLRALHYEYCIPDRPETIREVTAIDPTLEIQQGSPGRVGCDAGELLCLGHTHQTEYRVVLDRLAALSFVAEIREAFFE